MKAPAAISVAVICLIASAIACETGSDYCYYRLPPRDIPFANSALKAMNVPKNYWDPTAAENERSPVPAEFWGNVLFHCSGGKVELKYIWTEGMPVPETYCKHGCEFKLLDAKDACAKAPM